MSDPTMRDSDRLKITPLELPEAEVEHLLCDAYAAPPIPQTLLKRLDQAVAAEWGVSPRPVPASRGWSSRLSVHAGRMLKAWPVAACLAVVIALVVAFRGDAPAYGWQSMVEALTRQGLIQIGSADEASGVRWLFPAESIVGERSSQTISLLDFGRGVALQRGVSESQVHRSPLKSQDVASRDRLVLSFLLGGSAGDASNLRVLDESASIEGDEVHLHVTLGSNNSSKPVSLDIVLDPETHLPTNCRVVDEAGVARELNFSYPRTSASDMLASTFPVELAARDSSAAGVSAANAATIGNSATTQAGSGVSVATNLPENAAQPTSLGKGAASLGWSPLRKIDLPTDQIIRQVDQALDNLWDKQNVTPAAAATQEELIRRVYLDLVGRTPTTSEVRAERRNWSRESYAQLVDRLLASHDHATHLATVWRTILLPEGVDLTRFGGTEAFDKWLSGRFSENAPYDKLVRELLLAEGRLTKSGPLLFYTAMKLDADQLTARTSRVFLGIRLECAQCHDDPFEPWTQTDFWSFAAFFARISRPQAELDAVSTLMQVRDVDHGEVKMPNTEAAVPPRFLDGSSIDESPRAEARRRQLAAWLTGPDNPYFARAAVNRVWAHLFGHGIVDPVDAFGKEHLPKSPELLDLLAGHFIASGFDLRELFRVVALSKAYQLSSGGDSSGTKRIDWFAQMQVKTLTAEQIYDCIAVATLLNSPTAGQRGGLVSLERAGNASREAFLQQFRTPSGRRTEYERGIPEALTLMNGALISDATGLANSGLLKSLEAPFFTDDQRIEVIYLSTLSRQPSPAEWKLLRQYVSSRDPNVPVQQPLADILWAVLNSAEFTMNH